MGPVKGKSSYLIPAFISKRAIKHKHFVESAQLIPADGGNSWEPLVSLPLVVAVSGGEWQPKQNPLNNTFPAQLRHSIARARSMPDYLPDQRAKLPVSRLDFRYCTQIN